MTDATLLRSFVAVPLPGVVRAELADASRVFARELPDVSWSSKPENLHVTLRFLGPVAAERLDALGAALEGALAGLPRFGVDLCGFGAFPTEGRAEVLFVGVDDPRGGLARLAASVDEVARPLGFAPRDRAFSAHVTVGRARGKARGVDVRAALAPWAARAFGAVAVEEVHLYESRLGQRAGESSTYVLRHRAPLAARPAAQPTAAN